MDTCLTLAEVAALLRLNEQATYRLVRSGELLSIEVPRRGWLVATTDLAAYLRRPPA